jgi:Ser/Thr protein kinase RdoA (MazF antagonist)
MSSSISTDLRHSICQNYNIKIDAATPIGTGAMSMTVKLSTAQGALFLKCYKSDASLPTDNNVQQIAFTHAVQCFLSQNRLPVPRLLVNNAGKTYTRSGAQVYAVSEFIEGNNYDSTNPTETLHYAGEMLGRFHQQLRGFASSLMGSTRKGQSPIVCEWEHKEREVFAQLRERLAGIRVAVVDSPNPPLSPGTIELWLAELESLENELGEVGNSQWVIHGDYRAQNLKFDKGNRIRAILDLDTARPADRLFDLGYALVFFPAVYQDTPLTANQRAIFLSAYEKIVPLSATERKLLPLHLRLAFLRGMTLWLHLHFFAGMSVRTRPWIHGYLNSVETNTRF